LGPAAVQVPSEIPLIINDLSPAGRLVPLTPALEEILNAGLHLETVRREALAAALPIQSVPKGTSATNPLSKKTGPSAGPPLAETLTADLPLADGRKVAPKAVSEADQDGRKRDHPDRPPVFQDTPDMRPPRAAS